jgi:transposase
MDNLLSIKNKLAASNSKRKNKKALRLDKAISRMRRKIKRLQSEIHKSVAFFTCEFDAIIIPPFEVSNMTNRKTREITQKTVRKMLCWAHYQFRQRLVAKAEELGVHVMRPILQKLAAGVEGSIQKIGRSEVYNCRNCGTVMDQDENSPRRIFLRALLDGALILSGDHSGIISNIPYYY